MNRKMITAIFASSIALALSSATSLAADVNPGAFSTINESAPRSVFGDLNASAPRSPFDDIATSAPKSTFEEIRASAPRASSPMADIGDRAP